MKNFKKKLRKPTHEVVVPGDLAGNHEKAQEAIREQHLDSFIVGWKVTFRVVAFIGVLATPLIAAGGQLVGCECARTRREAETKYKSLQVRKLFTFLQSIPGFLYLFISNYIFFNSFKLSFCSELKPTCK